MIYFLAVLAPPLSVLLCGKPWQALLNVVLTSFFWIPGVLHALIVANGRNADRRTQRLVTAIRRGR